jgi:hypothetical protein
VTAQIDRDDAPLAREVLRERSHRAAIAAPSVNENRGRLAEPPAAIQQHAPIFTPVARRRIVAPREVTSIAGRGSKPLPHKRFAVSTQSGNVGSRTKWRCRLRRATRLGRRTLASWRARTASANEGLVVVRLEAFVHDDRESESCAGSRQRVAIGFYEATSERRGSGEPFVLDGSLRVNEDKTDNMLPVPLHRTGTVVAHGSYRQSQAANPDSRG